MTILYVDSPVNAIVKGFAVESRPMSPCHLTNEYPLLGIAYIVFTSEYGSSPLIHSILPNSAIFLPCHHIDSIIQSIVELTPADINIDFTFCAFPPFAVIVTLVSPLQL